MKAGFSSGAAGDAAARRPRPCDGGIRRGTRRSSNTARADRPCLRQASAPGSSPSKPIPTGSATWTKWLAHERRLRTASRSTTPTSAGTARWGRPKKARRRHWARYLRYPRSVWDRPDFEHPDLILVDGRFRVASFLCAMTRIRRPTRLLFDDCGHPARLPRGGTLQRPALIVDRMAVFDLQPQRLSLRDWIGDAAPAPRPRVAWATSSRRR